MAYQKKPLEEILDQFEISTEDLDFSPSNTMDYDDAAYSFTEDGQLHIVYLCDDLSPCDPMEHSEEGGKIYWKAADGYDFWSHLGRSDYGGELDIDLCEQYGFEDLWVEIASKSLEFTELISDNRNQFFPDNDTDAFTVDDIRDAAESYYDDYKNGGWQSKLPIFENLLMSSWQNAMQLDPDTRFAVPFDLNGDCLSLYDPEDCLLKEYFEPDAVWVPSPSLKEYIETEASTMFSLGEIKECYDKDGLRWHVFLNDESEPHSRFKTEAKAKNQLRELYCLWTEATTSEERDKYLSEISQKGLTRRYMAIARACKDTANSSLHDLNAYYAGNCYYSVVESFRNTGTKEEPVWSHVGSDTYGGLYGTEAALELMMEYLPVARQVTNAA